MALPTLPTLQVLDGADIFTLPAPVVKEIGTVGKLENRKKLHLF